MPTTTSGDMIFTTFGPSLSVAQIPTFSVFVNGDRFTGTPLTTTADVQLLNASVTYGLDVGISSATIELTADPNLSKYTIITVYADATPKTIPTLRFTGIFLRTEANLWPHSYTMICRGMLYFAQQYQQIYQSGNPLLAAISNIPLGVYLFDLVNNNGTTVPGILGHDPPGTDQEIIQGVLSVVSAAYPQFTFTPTNIGGTGFQFGVLSFLDLVWPPYMSAIAYIQRLDECCLGYRLYESLGGVLHRDQIFGYPSGVSDYQFTEGIDIWEGKGTRSVEELINAVLVEGHSLQKERLPFNIAFLQSSNPFQPSTAPDVDEFGMPTATPGWNPIIDQFKSVFIETCDAFLALGGDPRTNGALNANDVARWKLGERNRELVKTSFTTYLDMPLFPGRTISVLTPHMAVTEPQWLQRVEVRVQAQPTLFQQTVYTIGGGTGAYGLNATVAAGSTTTTIYFSPGVLEIDQLIDNLISLPNSNNPNNSTLPTQRTAISNTANSVTVSVPFDNTPIVDEIIILQDYRPPLLPPFN